MDAGSGFANSLPAFCKSPEKRMEDWFSHFLLYRVVQRVLLIYLLVKWYNKNYQNTKEKETHMNREREYNMDYLHKTAES